MSLKENTADASDVIKLDFQTRALLLQNLSEMHFHAIGLQECRTNDRSFAIPGYQCVASGHINRNFGVELWLSSSEDIVCIDPVSHTEIKIAFDLEQLVIVHKEPRLLIVSVGIHHESMTFVVLHAPDQTHGTLNVTAWWDNFFSLISKYSIDLSTAIIIGDFNLRFGSRLSFAVGDFFKQKQHSGARALHKWMVENKFFLPATFSGHQDTSPAHTYTHSNGSLHRIDYVMVPYVVNLYPYTTGTYDPEFSSVVDHIGTWVSFCLPLKTKHRIPKCKIGYDSALFSDPVRVAAFNDEMALGTFDAHLFHDNTSRSHYYTTFTYYALCHSFPTSARKPLKPYISLHTVDLIANRNRARALFKHVRLHPHECWWLPGLNACAARFKACVKAVRSSICRDFHNYTSSKCSKAQHAHDNGDQRAFFQIKRSLCPHPPSTPTCVMDGDTPCVYYKDIRLAFQKYFCNLLQGETMPVSDAISDIFFEIKKCGSLNIPVPTVDQLCDIVKKCNSNSAPGPDGLKYCVLQHFPWLIQILYPIFLDACTNLPPTQWCASILHELIKKHGDTSSLTNYRDILLCDVVGKLFKRHFRGCMLVHIESYILDTMCGGFMRRGVDFCSHYLRAITSIAKAKQLSCAILFLDVKTAFASVIRELIYHGRMSDGDIMKLFHKFNFKPEIFQQFRAVMESPSAMEIAQVPENLTKAFASFVGNSYFHTKGVEAVVVYESGTGAGNPLADLAFAFLAARVLHEADTRIIADNLHVDIPDTPLSIVSTTPLGSGKFTGASYVDDTFYACTDKSPAVCVEKCRSICSIVIDVFSCHGLLLNYLFGKTGFLFQLRGTNAVNVIKSFEGTPPHIPVTSLALGTTDIFVYSDYKHVGSFCNTTASYAQEAGMRCNASKAAKKDISRMCRSNKLLSKSKIHLTHTFGASVIFSNVASIPFWPKGAVKKLTKAYDSLYRAATVSRADKVEIQHEHTLTLFKKHNIALCYNKLVTIRLKYLRGVIEHAPPFLKK